LTIKSDRFLTRRAERVAPVRVLRGTAPARYSRRAAPSGAGRSGPSDAAGAAPARYSRRDGAARAGARAAVYRYCPLFPRVFRRQPRAVKLTAPVTPSHAVLSRQSQSVSQSHSVAVGADLVTPDTLSDSLGRRTPSGPGHSQPSRRQRSARPGGDERSTRCLTAAASDSGQPGWRLTLPPSCRMTFLLFGNIYVYLL